MVRFIIIIHSFDTLITSPFTFQYGQIYYVDYILYVGMSVYHLHSNMVRFIILLLSRTRTYLYRFRFQYGQIYYRRTTSIRSHNNRIYIPIWLDLLLEGITSPQELLENLHSNMVRFIIRLKFRLILKPNSIYIPIWLDLLFIFMLNEVPPIRYLHSNMVRFIMQFLVYHNNKVDAIYIPIWLDLLLGML